MDLAKISLARDKEAWDEEAWEKWVRHGHGGVELGAPDRDDEEIMGGRNQLSSPTLDSSISSALE